MSNTLIFITYGLGVLASFLLGRNFFRKLLPTDYTWNLAVINIFVAPCSWLGVIAFIIVKLIR